MTNHIEELMKAAGVKQYKRTYFECKGGRSTICLCPQIGVPNAWCKEDCNGEEMREKVEYFTPAFTPAKQLELIKLLAERKGYSGIGEQIDYFTEIYGLTFENAIAQITSNAISSKILNKSEVKRILKDDTNL